ncbi:hypothetical protein DRL80_01080 [Salmonella enterica subsp. enterica]|nr:hypothetical protein [Salmonella enterica]EBN0301184.1 hypothetical protein [Salmonella enterica subsp. enterica serovar Newport]EDJ9003142.1 hypothetical protein [Salmonella enterica subsp. enterica serovar Bovismorbificans]EBQ3708314.1 hypothetical protein [Salmonella enterica]ECC7192303.1 hypothetical protein [Salmonella enterica]
MISTTSDSNDAIAFNMPHVKIIRSYVIQHVAILCRKIKQALFGVLVCLWGESTDAEAQQLGSQHRKNNNPRARGDFFCLNSLRRVLFYGDR